MSKYIKRIKLIKANQKNKNLPKVPQLEKTNRSKTLKNKKIYQFENNREKANTLGLIKYFKSYKLKSSRLIIGKVKLFKCAHCKCLFHLRETENGEIKTYEKYHFYCNHEGEEYYDPDDMTLITYKLIKLAVQENKLDKPKEIIKKIVNRETFTDGIER
jgi:hypothetical protein